MKLPDFFNFEPFLTLKRGMGIPSDHTVDFKVTVAGPRLTEVELERLSSGEGIAIDSSQLAILDDQTLTYKGKRVLVYIRDVSSYGDDTSRPRYHIAKCSTLESAWSEGVKKKYVVANRTDGIFRINIRSSGKHTASDERLSVCRNCLHELRFENYSSRLSANEKSARVAEFIPARFFEKYPIDAIRLNPKYDSDTAPLNRYGSDFHLLSRQIKTDFGWKCSDCGLNFGSRSLQRYLHVHHANMQKWDNSATNLIPLCIQCHAERPYHSHLKANPDYKRSLSAFTARRPR